MRARALGKKGEESIRTYGPYARRLISISLTDLRDFNYHLRFLPYSVFGQWLPDLRVMRTSQ